MALLATRLNARPLLVTAAILAAIIPLLVASVYLVQYVANQALAVQKDVRSARIVRDAALALQIDEETGIRGYVLTREREFLQPYNNAIKRVPERLAELRRDLALLGLNDAVAATDDATAINARWLATVATPILRDPTPAHLVLERNGKALIDRYRAQLRSITAALTKRQDEADVATVNAVNRIILVGLLAVSAIILIALVFGARQAALVARLEESEQRAAQTRRVREFQTLGQAMEQMLWTARPDGTIDYYSERWSEFSGFPAGAMASEGWISLVHPDDVAGLEAWHAALRDVTRVTFENRLRRHDGTYRWHRHRILPIRDTHDEVTAWFASSTDIEEQKHEVATLQAAYDAEKRIADTLQEALLQQALPTVAGLSFSATYVPASDEAKVGGDWYDALKLPDGRLFFSMGDVAGHGLEAAIIMSRARQAIISAALHEIDPAIVLTRANTTLLVQNSRMVTSVCGFIDPATFGLSYASAGHPPPVLIEPGRAPQLLQTGGLPLAVMQSVTYHSQRVNVAPGSMLVLYTDGAVEHSRDALAGESILLAASTLAMESAPAVRAEKIHDTIFATRTVGDDVAIMTVAFGNEMVLPDAIAHELNMLGAGSRTVRRVLTSPPAELARVARG
jgi:PAS domain S-box-containing protein